MKAIIKLSLIMALLLVLNAQQTQNDIEQVKDSYHQMIRQMQVGETVNAEESAQMNEMLLKQIFIWSSIFLTFVLYFAFMGMIEMPIQKTSILYAKYVTSNSQQENH